MALDGAIVLITGGCGQVGVAITRQIRRQYPACKLHVLDLTTPASSAPQFVESVVYHEGNVTDVSAVRTVFTAVKPEVVFHTAGLIPQIAMRLGINQEHNYMQVNVEGTRNLLEEAKALGSRVRAFIYTSSADIAKGNSWDNLVNVNEQMEMPARFDNAYAKSKVCLLGSFSPSSHLKLYPIPKLVDCILF
jgi:sterol-4alpha-carboxylate 3-dehydrogenase (decarboxylating)